MSAIGKTNLITAKEVVEKSFSGDKNFQTTKIKNTLIFAAQEKWIRPVLGENLYVELLKQLNNNSITPLNQVLLDGYIKPCLAYYVKYLALPYISRPVTNQGVKEFFSQYSKASDLSDVKSLQVTTKIIADALVDAMTRFIELNKKDFELYLEENNVRNRVRTVGGVIIRRGKRKTKTIYTNVPEALPNYYIFSQISSVTEWAFSYKGKIKNEGVQVARVLDSNCNDITDYANILINSDNETVLITFTEGVEGTEGAFLNENDKSGTVELYTATAAEAANLVRGYIEITDVRASFTLTEGEVSNETYTYKWYINEDLTNVTADNIYISDLWGKGYLRCELWQNGKKELSVFERYTLVLSDEDGEIIVDDDLEVNT